MVGFDIATRLAIAYAILIGVIHFLGGSTRPPGSRARYRIISFAAGVYLAYLFLDLLPKTYEAATYLRQWVFVFLLIGFSIVHLSEKWMNQHHDGGRLDTELNTVDSIAFFVYNFVVGIALLEKMREPVGGDTLFHPHSFARDAEHSRDAEYSQERNGEHSRQDTSFRLSAIRGSLRRCCEDSPYPRQYPHKSGRRCASLHHCQGVHTGEG